MHLIVVLLQPVLIICHGANGGEGRNGAAAGTKSKCEKNRRIEALLVFIALGDCDALASAMCICPGVTRWLPKQTTAKQIKLD